MKLSITLAIAMFGLSACINSKNFRYREAKKVSASTELSRNFTWNGEKDQNSPSVAIDR